LTITDEELNLVYDSIEDAVTRVEKTFT